MVPEFREWPKIPRLNRECIVTEKIDGTNGCVVVTADGVFAQSRNVTLTDNDPFGFLAWVTRNADALRATLGEGYHYGEWWLLREPDEIEEVERSLREAVGMLAAAEPLTSEEEAEVGAFFAMLRKMP